MCKYSAKLIAWIDGEIPAVEAAEVARHVAACAECRSCAAECRRVSGTFEEYCDAVLHGSERRDASWHKPALLAAAAAIALALVFAHSRRPAAPSPQAPPETASTAASAPPVQPAIVGASRREKHGANRRHHRLPPAAAVPLQAHAQTASVETLGARVTSDEPALRIAIPADAMFAPGALPEGMTFVADLSIGADGRVEQLRLVPQPVPLQRRLEQ